MPVRSNAKPLGRTTISLSLRNWITGGHLIDIYHEPEPAPRRVSRQTTTANQSNEMIMGEEISYDPVTGQPTKGVKYCRTHPGRKEEAEKAKKAEPDERKKKEAEKKPVQKEKSKDTKKKVVIVEDTSNWETSDDDGKVTFTSKQDKTIKGMKRAGKTWAEIAAAVHKGKNEVKARFQELTRDDDSGDVDEDHVNYGSYKLSDANKVDGLRGGGGSSSKNTFTPEQDETIKSMKANDKTWNEIAAAVGSSKKDVTARWKEILDEIAARQPSPALDLDGLGINIGEFKPASNLSSIDGLDFSNLFGPDTRKKSPNANETSAGGYQKSPGGYTTSAGGYTTSAGGYATANSGHSPSNSLTKSNVGSPSKRASPAQNFGFANPFFGSPRYNAQFGGRLKADGSFSKHDCDVLDYLEHKFNEDKWLSIQSSFYHYTGRLISRDVMEKKFRDDGAL